MYPRTKAILDHLASQRKVLEVALSETPASARNRRPAPDQWSIAEVLEHLVIVQARVLRVFTENLDPIHDQLGPELEDGSVVGMVDLDRLVDRSRKLVASDAAQPRGQMSADEAWKALADGAAVLKEKIIANDGLAIGTITAMHPRLGELNLYQWLVFLGGHEARHAAQIRDAAASLSSMG